MSVEEKQKQTNNKTIWTNQPVSIWKKGCRRVINVNKVDSLFT